MDTANNNFLTIGEAAAWLDISPRTIKRMIKQGLPSVKKAGLGRRVLKQQAEAYLISPEKRPKKTRQSNKIQKPTDITPPKA